MLDDTNTRSIDQGRRCPSGDAGSRAPTAHADRLRGGVPRRRWAERGNTHEQPLSVGLRQHSRSWNRQAAEKFANPRLWQDHGLVFRSEIGTPIDPANLRRTVARIAKKSDIGHVFPYPIRPNTFSHLIDNGATIEEVADLGGDRPETICQHFRHQTGPPRPRRLGCGGSCPGPRRTRPGRCPRDRPPRP
jgi:hypothetical protein